MNIDTLKGKICSLIDLTVEENLTQTKNKRCDKLWEEILAKLNELKEKENG
jgi:hypothetical protein